MVLIGIWVCYEICFSKAQCDVISGFCFDADRLVWRDLVFSLCAFMSHIFWIYCSIKLLHSEAERICSGKNLTDTKKELMVWEEQLLFSPQDPGQVNGSIYCGGNTRPLIPRWYDPSLCHYSLFYIMINKFRLIKIKLWKEASVGITQYFTYKGHQPFSGSPTQFGPPGQ